jgi:hypothetical protein
MHYQDLHSDSISSPSAAIDDRNYFTTVFGANSQSHKCILECVTQLISIYNARGHQIKSFCTDSVPICQSLMTPLGLLHCSISHTTPDMRRWRC